MGEFNMHKIKRMAHREAWYAQSSNPFRRTRTGFGQSADEENGGDRILTTINSEPISRSPLFSSEDPTSSNTAANRLPVNKTFEMTPAQGFESRKEQSSEKTAVDSQSTGHPMSLEQSTRKRILSKFGERSTEETNPTRSTTGMSEKKLSKSSKQKRFTVGNQLKATIFNSWINILLLAAPVGIALHFVNVSPVAVFVINFIAIIPLAALLSYATEEIAIRVGETLGGLLNASFGNAVELIVSIIALVKKEVVIVKTSLIGSILSNLLLVMGMCFFFGGLKREKQFFNETVAQTAASLLALAIASVIIPTAFDIFTKTDDQPIAAISRGTAIILLAVYGAYLYFQLKTHATIYQKESEKATVRPSKHKIPEGGISKGIAQAGGIGAAQGRTHLVGLDVPLGDEIMQRDAYEQQVAADKEMDEPQLALVVAVGLLAASTCIVALCAEFMVDSISDITSGNSGISVEFVGLILLPIVGNAAEHATAVTVAVKDKMDLAIGVAVGSSMQISLLVIPFTVVLGWILGQDEMNLSFDGFQVAVLFVSILLVNYLISDGQSHWLEGALLQALYLIIAVTSWFYPKTPLNEGSQT